MKQVVVCDAAGSPVIFIPAILQGEARLTFLRFRASCKRKSLRHWCCRALIHRHLWIMQPNDFVPSLRNAETLSPLASLLSDINRALGTWAPCLKEW
jgi:hypothetical protein